MKIMICAVAFVAVFPLAADSFCRQGHPCRMTDPKNLFGTIRCNMPSVVMGQPVAKPSNTLTYKSAKETKGKLRNAYAGDLKIGQRVRVVMLHKPPIDALTVGFIPHGQDLYVEFVSGEGRFVVHGLHFVLVASTDPVWLRHHRVAKRESSALGWTAPNSQSSSGPTSAQVTPNVPRLPPVHLQAPLKHK